MFAIEEDLNPYFGRTELGGTQIGAGSKVTNQVFL